MSAARTEIEVTVLDRASGALRRIRDRLGNLNDGRVGRAMAAVSRSVKQAIPVFAAYGAAAAAGIGGAAYFAKEVMETGASFERYRTILTTLEGGSEKAKKSMEWISDFAAKTPYEVNEVTDAFIKLKAYGMDPMKDGLLNSLGDTAAAMGKPVMQVVEAIADAVTGENERLKEFGIKASKIKGKNEIVYSYTDKDGKQRSAKAAADNREQIQKTLQTIWNEKYGGAMDKLSGTWEGMISNLSDQWERLKLLIADSGVFEFLKGKLEGFLDKVNRMAEDGSLQKLAEDIGAKMVKGIERLWEMGGRLYDRFVQVNEFFGGFENTMTAVAVVLSLPLVAAIANIGIAVGSLATALVGAIPGITAFGAALLANPITWIVAGIVAGAAAAYLVYENWDKVSGWLGRVWDTIKDTFGDSFDFIADLFMNFTPIGLMMQAMSPVLDWVAENWEAIKETFAAAFDYLGGLFMNFTPLGWMIQAFSGVLAYVTENWDGIKKAVSDALAKIGSVLSGFNPLSFVKAAFDRLKGFVGSVFDSIVDKARQVLNITQDVQQQSASLASPAAVAQGMSMASSYARAEVKFVNPPPNVRTRATTSNSPAIRANQGRTNS